jgi:hypothetical protein
MRCRLLRELEQSPALPQDWQYFEQHGHFEMLPAGTVINNPSAFQLVRLGVAVADDEQCERAHGMNQQQLDAARHAAERVGLGIHPDDYPAYEAGQMRGYNPDGSWIPGPNFSDESEDSEE